MIINNIEHFLIFVIKYYDRRLFWKCSTTSYSWLSVCGFLVHALSFLLNFHSKMYSRFVKLRVLYVQVLTPVPLILTCVLTGLSWCPSLWGVLLRSKVTTEFSHKTVHIVVAILINAETTTVLRVGILQQNLRVYFLSFWQCSWNSK